MDSWLRFSLVYRLNFSNSNGRLGLRHKQTVRLALLALVLVVLLLVVVLALVLALVVLLALLVLRPGVGSQAIATLVSTINRVISTNTTSRDHMLAGTI